MQLLGSITCQVIDRKKAKTAYSVNGTSRLSDFAGECPFLAQSVPCRMSPLLRRLRRQTGLRVNGFRAR